MIVISVQPFALVFLILMLAVLRLQGVEAIEGTVVPVRSLLYDTGGQNRTGHRTGRQ